MFISCSVSKRRSRVISHTIQILGVKISSLCKSWAYSWRFLIMWLFGRFYSDYLITSSNIWWVFDNLGQYVWLFDYLMFKKIINDYVIILAKHLWLCHYLDNPTRASFLLMNRYGDMIRTPQFIIFQLQYD